MSELIDSAVMPGMQGGPLMHIIAAKAVAFGEALKPEFKIYARQIVDNARSMAEEFLNRGFQLVSGGTDTHLILIDLTNKNITGKETEDILAMAGITVNKNMVPFDKRSPFITSGIRIGTPAVTTRNMGKGEMIEIVGLIDQIISGPEDPAILRRTKQGVIDLCKSFPLYEEFHE